jgi:hypothetical protein
LDDRKNLLDSDGIPERTRDRQQARSERRKKHAGVSSFLAPAPDGLSIASSTQAGRAFNVSAPRVPRGSAMNDRSKRLALTILLAAAPLPGVLRAESEGTTAEFQVNSFTTGSQVQPVVAAESGGGFIVAWNPAPGAGEPDGDRAAILARRFDDAARPRGPEMVVNSYTTASQMVPAVACAPADTCLIAWGSLRQDGSDGGVFGQILDADGAPLGDEFQINVFTDQFQGSAAIAAVPAGFVVVWSSGGDQDGDGYGVFGRSFDTAGRPLSDEVQVNTYTTGSQGSSAIAAGPDRSFLVLWESNNQDGSGTGIFAQLYDPRGIPSGAEFQVNSYTPFNQRYVHVASSEDGYLVVWHSDHDGAETGIFAQFYDTAANPVGGELQVNTYTTGRQHNPTVGADGRGGFVVAWVSDGQDGSEGGVFAQRYDNEANPIGGEFALNRFTAGTQTRPHIATSSPALTVVWESADQDGDGRGIFGRVLAFPDCAGDCNEDGRVAIAELVLGVNVALGRAAIDACPAFDENGDDAVGINELIRAVSHALQGCP